MSEIKTYEIPAAIAAKAHINAEQYASMYQRSVDDPNGFWAEQAEKFVTWSKKFDTVMDYSFSPENLYIKWFEGGQLNVSLANVLKAKGVKKGDRVTIYLPMIPEAAYAMLACAASAPSTRSSSAASRRTACRPHPGLRLAGCVITADEGCAAAARCR
jgi:acetyl-CoA synthetase